MAITWTGAGGVFTRIGKLLKAFLQFEEWQKAGTDTIPDLADEVLDAFGDDRDLVVDLFELMEAQRDALDSVKGGLVPYAENVIRALAGELDAPSTDLAILWPLLVQAMNDETPAQTVDANTVAATPTPDEDNLGSGELVVSTQDEDAVERELAIPETMTVECVTDSQTGAAEGREVFQVSGEVPAPSSASWRTRGSGLGPTLTVANESAENCVLNGGFEEYEVANTPDDWVIEQGTVGVHIFLAGSPFFLVGAKALKFAGDGSQAIIRIYQSFPALKLKPRTKYALGLWIATTSVTQGTIAVKLAGTDWAPAGISIAAGWPESYAFYSCVINTPALVPDDAYIQIDVTGTPNAGSLFFFDAVAVVPMVEHNDLAFALFQGADAFACGDKFSVAVTNDEAGIFQTLFGRLWGMQLPSDDEGGETIDDALITA